MNSQLVQMSRCAYRLCSKQAFNLAPKNVQFTISPKRPLLCRYLHQTKFRLQKQSNPEEDDAIPTDSDVDGKRRIPQSISEKYSPFEDRQRIIQDVIEEQWDPIIASEEMPQKIIYERGKTGVFDLQELVDLLEEERAMDICVIKIPKEMDYADYMTIVSARSPKHMFAMATFIRKRFKSKELKSTDVLPRIEGTEASNDWIAIDLGNIILHIFMPEFRDMLDLETLWTCGAKYDDLSHQKDSEIVQLLKMFE